MDRKGDVVIVNTPEALAEKGACLLSETAGSAVAAWGESRVVLSGGSTPRPMHRLLGSEPLRSRIPWHRMHLFWGDERCVPACSPESNYGLAREDLLERIAIPPGHVHPMPGEMDPETGAASYEKDLMASLTMGSGARPALDLLFLGLGPDGHTASLFPGHPALEERKRWVVAVKGGRPDVYRLTMTFPLMNRAGKVVFMASGEEKAEVVKAILEGENSDLPAGRIAPFSGTLLWVLDRDAASLLSRGTAHG
jgi:6-phosphogluconolactonase